ncbi:DNA polymerase III subunit delta [Acinetobacter lwoffii]|uniref:DNA polymerase III subunit delta n=1 Tax=Acinetobacter lwoffii NCTC 5866 = CIP 64.10 = NIPH 512 TaxID=981327 RepID=A0ABN0PUG4_ACILW|nr:MULTISPECIES: DNA polymerase III subunit delta [Acinetobacter]ENU15742.1 DNA polymerase III, delta subunit [Acinetobacter sp. CIP A162]ESJ94057.1 DNA polymerase III, delta subunit [Acinetobacter lwoffii NCTC 5866 = CIP 64.10 = NIPH 512]MCO8061485.1 DNA polymerase III subunit delta [Acinetobacter lwoffii]MCO8080637.1 DNA polymerase III subunit delta [Acinetobacter lwoffii]MCO8095245.1 DNA polymerase III subunit delta [Acinetobacter lwoffii]
MKLDYLQALKRVDEARGAWVLHGQEPLLEQNLIDAFRSSWQKQDIERQRYDISSVADWKTVFNALNSLSLFSTQLAIEVHGNIKPDASSLKLLKSYLQQDSDNLLLVVMPKQDASSLKTSFFQVIDANGVNVSLVANYPKDRQQILGIEAEKLGIRLANDAWQWLEQHHEHNLLAAKNSLMRVSDTFAEIDVIQVEHLYACLQDQSRYSTYDLSDALLQGNLSQSIKIFQYLVASGEPMSLILWSLSKEMRLLMQLFEQPQNALQIGIWKTKVGLYQQALRRLSPQTFLAWPGLLLRIDASIKGFGHENPEHLVLQAISSICGKPLFH